MARAPAEPPRGSPPPQRQHLIDPETCIKCRSCEQACPAGAIVTGPGPLAVDPALCTHCGTCVGECPTGAIDRWRTVLCHGPYSIEEQASWQRLPFEEWSATSRERGHE